jgi:Rgg/GadR/MutR family transcriptional activator
MTINMCGGISMGTFGTTFRSIRKSKMITLKDIEAQTGITSSFISRFERGKSDITLTNMVTILSAINIDLQEFMTEHYEQTNPRIEPNTQSAKLAQAQLRVPHLAPFLKFGTIDHHNYAAVVKEMNRMATVYRIAPTRSNHFIYLFYEMLVLVAKHSDDTPTAELFRLGRPIVQYLQQVETWGRYELYLFQMFASAIPDADNLRLLRMGLKKINRQLGTTEFHGMAFNLLTADFTAQISLHHLALASAILTEIDNYAHINAGEAIIRIFYHGWLQIKQKDIVSGQMKCHHAIDLCRELEQQRQANQLRDLLDNILRDPDFGVVLINL